MRIVKMQTVHQPPITAARLIKATLLVAAFVYIVHWLY